MARFTFRGIEGDLQVIDMNSSDGVHGILAGDVTEEKCVAVAGAMGFVSAKKMGKTMFSDWDTESNG